MEKKTMLTSLRNKKYYALLVGFVVASLHFVINLILDPLWNRASRVFSLGDVIVLLLMVPSFVLIIINHLSLPSSVTNLDLLSPLAIAFSSFFYGIMGGSLASNRKILRWIGFIFMGLLVLSNCFIWFAIAGSTAGEYQR